MSFRLIISPAVKQEIAEAFAWYAERNSQAADNFREEVLAAFGLIAQHPERFPLWGDVVRRFVMKKFLNQLPTNSLHKNLPLKKHKSPVQKLIARHGPLSWL